MASPTLAPPRPPDTRTRHAVAIAVRSAQMLAGGASSLRCFVREWRALRADPDRAMRAAGRALVHGCTRLGATFIKVGQIASTRADLLPEPLRLELARLQDRVPAFPFAAVRETIEGEFGRSLESLFERFDPEPVAAASVAQVHRAVWHGHHEVVAVKVRRPDILEKVRLDRSILIFVARVLERLVPTLRLIALEGAMRQFCEAVEQQIHLRNEAEHNRRFRQNFADDPDVRFPRLVPEACTDAVLTMEFVEGVREEDLAAQGVDVQRVVEAGMRAVCRMIFLHGFVHSDLHPGNLRFVPPGGIVFLDLGLVGELASVDRVTTASLLFALATGDGKTVARLFYENAPWRRTPDYAAYEREIAAYVDSVRVRGLGKLQITLEIGRLFDILRRHRIQARSHMTMVNLALMTAEGLGKRLAPDLSLADEAIPYLAEALGRAAPAPERASAGAS
jgi:ubiquinone biosynthesis protein